MINMIVLEYLCGPNISFILPTYTEHCACYSRETDNMVLQSSHCYSRSPMEANIILIQNLITTLEYWCHNGQHVLAAVYLVGSSIICRTAFQLPRNFKNIPAFKPYIFLTQLDIHLISNLSSKPVFIISDGCRTISIYSALSNRAFRFNS